MIILIDDGHGYDTSGNIGPVYPEGQIEEWQFNADIANRVHGLCLAQGISAFKLAPEDANIDLNERVRRANRWGKDSFLVSIHANASGQSGWEAWYWQNSTTSKGYAQIFLDVAKAALPEFRMRGIFESGKDGPGFAILRDTIMPAVLTENLFFDNPKDAAFMLTEQGRQRIAELHVAAIKFIVNGTAK